MIVLSKIMSSLRCFLPQTNACIEVLLVTSGIFMYNYITLSHYLVVPNWMAPRNQKAVGDNSVKNLESNSKTTLGMVKRDRTLLIWCRNSSLLYTGNVLNSMLYTHFSKCEDNVKSFPIGSGVLFFPFKGWIHIGAYNRCIQWIHSPFSGTNCYHTELMH